MDIDKIKNALYVFEDLLPTMDFEQVKRIVGSAIIDKRVSESETKYANDLEYVGIDMKLDVDQADYEDVPF